jgi:hypothetical protein
MIGLKMTGNRMIIGMTMITMTMKVTTMIVMITKKEIILATLLIIMTNPLRLMCYLLILELLLKQEVTK